MTTITLNTKLDLKKTSFENEIVLFKYLATLTNDFDDPSFEDTIVTPEIEAKAKAAREKLTLDPSQFQRSI